jgi:DNA-binding response OmpR family regulator
MPGMAGWQQSVLCVDDDRSVLELVSALLENEGLTVETAGSAAEALQKFSPERFGLVLLDLGLPDVHGLELLETLSTLRGPTKFVILTADGTAESVLGAVRENAYDYIRKPFNPTGLVDVVKKALSATSYPDIEVISAKPEWLELSLPCTREAADRIEHFVRQLKSDLPDDVREDVSQAFRELLMNAVEWGGGLDPKSRVRMAYIRTKQMLLYRIADPGPGFKFEGLEHAAISNPGNDPLRHQLVREEKGIRAGGLGLLMVRSMMDELVYNEAQNEVVCIKYLHG